MSNVDIPQILPDVFMIDAPASGGKSVLRKNLMEVLPTENIDYTYASNRIIRFNISSGSDVLVGKESYLKFNLTFSHTNAYGATDPHPDLEFDVGGAHNLFRSVELRALSSSSLIQRAEHYNTKYIIDSLLKQDPEYVKSQGFKYLDFVQDAKEQFPKYTLEPLMGAGIATDVNGDLTIAASDIIRNQIQVGDIIVDNNGNDGTDFYHTVVQVDLANTQLELEPPMKAGQSAAAVFAYDLKLVRTHAGATSGDAFTTAHQEDNFFKLVQPDKSVRWMMREVGSGGVEVIMQLNLSTLFLNYPLFLMKGGIELVLELEQPDIALRSADLDASNAYAYQISSPRFMAMMVTPHEDVVNEMVKEWQTRDGLLYRIPSYKVRRLTGTTTEQSTDLQMNFGVRSPLRGYLVTKDSVVSNGGSGSQIYQSLSNFVRGNISNYQFRVGSHEFPNRDVDTAVDSLEAYHQLQMTAGVANRATRLSYGQFADPNILPDQDPAYLAKMQKHFIIGVDFARVKGPYETMTGIDMSISPLDIRITRNAQYDNNLASGWSGAPVYYMFVEYDAFLKISSSQITVFN